jgi:phenylalanine ammonia-lyase
VRVVPLFHAFAQLKLHIITFLTVLKLVVPPRATADTRTNHTIGLGHALIQHHHTGVLPSSASLQDSLPALPLSDPLAAMSMPEAWVCGAILVRINSLIRGHSAVRWELLEKMVTLLHEDITPFVPLRGSISASGGTSV